MTRSRATALALVNWKGVFYERYQLDPHVTALEGANGSGKTTVMIAAYVVLLPDMTRLRFTNLGESGATGGDRGIWGRLGRAGGPSYAAMEIAIPDSDPIIAAIQLERKAEPSVELTPFLISGVKANAKLRDIFLVRDGEDEAIPQMGDVREAVRRLGGQIDVFASAKEYFAALFERGVMPLRMSTDEDRNKYNDLLRTSMSGGISRALTTDLRGFVLKEETGLGDALSRMRQNVDACHRTRVEVSEARGLEREISGVHEAGQAMFAAAMLTVRAQAEELAASETRAKTARTDAANLVRDLEQVVDATRGRQEARLSLLTEARASLTVAADRCERAARAFEFAQQLEGIERELAETTEKVDAANAAQQAAEAARTAQKQECDRAREAYHRAAGGLSDLESGIEELHRNAHARRVAHRRLADAREALGNAELGETDIDATLEHVRTRLAAIDVQWARFDRDFESLTVRRDEYARAAEALSRVAGPALQEKTHEVARQALARLADLEALPPQIPDLTAALERSSQLAVRQSAARGRASRLGLSAAEGSSALAAERRLDETEKAARADEELSRAQTARATEARRAGEAARTRAEESELLASRRREALIIAGRIEAGYGVAVRSRDALAEVRARLAAERDAVQGPIAEGRRLRESLLREAAALESRAPFHPDLLRLRDELDGELLAARFEDFDLDEAARVEADLGPMANAIVVAEPRAAAQKLIGKPRELDSVWLVPRDASFDEHERDTSLVAGTDRIVANAHGVRVTRLPERPTLGRRARERRATELRAQALKIDGDVQNALSALGALESLGRDADRLGIDVAALEGEDPAASIERARAAIDAAEAAEQKHLAAASAAKARAAAIQPKVDGLRALLGDAFLLDPPDHAAESHRLSDALVRATNAKAELRRVADARRVLSELIEALRAPPPSREELDASVRSRAEANLERERLLRALEALSGLVQQRHALRLEDVEGLVAERQTIGAALKAQLVQAGGLVGIAEDALRKTETLWEARTRELQKAEAAYAATIAHQTRVESELARVGANPLSQPALEAARQTVEEQRARQKALEEDERRMATEVALLRERQAHAVESLRARENEVAAQERLVLPAAADWARAVREAQAAGVLEDAIGTRFEETHARRSSAELRPEASGRAEVLLDRLKSARGGAECIPLAAAAASSEGARSVEAPLKAWLAVRGWVKQRLPAELGALSEPLRALERLRDQLAALEPHLAGQESDLRGVSGDVARGIDVQLRRAVNQVRQLNKNLEGVAFGSIAGIRVQAQRIERMDQVLRALREGAVQELLFQPTMPIEEALDEIFRRYGGGRTGGKRILDYREYIDLTVEIRRRSGGTWESASSTRLSTGEAIGVGSALIMVILSEWERGANLLRAKRGGGSLRFLLLDEANRLSQDNLGVLFDLCESLDVQLLIAAPEVARASGNTTFRLVRTITEDGREDVLVSGRRTPSPDSRPE